MGAGTRLKDALGVLAFGDSYSQIARKVSIYNQIDNGNKNPIGKGTGEKEFEELYRNNAYAKQIVSVPVEDALAKGWTWQGEDVKQEEIDKIRAYERLPAIDLNTKLEEALICARIFGGSAILIDTEDDDLSLPLDPETITEGGVKSLKVMSRFQFGKVDIEKELDSPEHGNAILFHLSIARGGKKGQSKIHPSRLVVFHGDKIPVPRGIRTDQEFWGDGILRSRMVGVIALEQAYTSQEALLMEAKSPTLAFPKLSVKMSTPEGRDQIFEEALAFNNVRGSTGLNIIDTEMKFDNNAYNFSGIKDIIDGFKSRVAGEADIPEARLFGERDTGLNSTGQGSLKNYYDRIKSDQENKIMPPMSILIIALVRSALGKTKKTIKPVWNPLMIPTAKERAEIFSIYATQLNQLNKDEIIDETETGEYIKRLLNNALIGDS